MIDNNDEIMFYTQQSTAFKLVTFSSMFFSSCNSQICPFFGFRVRKIKFVTVCEFDQ